MKETKMIFNISQANLFLANGCKAVGCGLGRRNKVYVEFEVDTLFLEIMKKWKNKEFSL